MLAGQSRSTAAATSPRLSPTSGHLPRPPSFRPKRTGRPAVVQLQDGLPAARVRPLPPFRWISVDNSPESEEIARVKPLAAGACVWLGLPEIYRCIFASCSKPAPKQAQGDGYNSMWGSDPELKGRAPVVLKASVRPSLSTSSGRIPFPQKMSPTEERAKT